MMRWASDVGGLEVGVMRQEELAMATQSWQSKSRRDTNISLCSLENKSAEASRWKAEWEAYQVDLSVYDLSLS
jgi:hypothetical protein